MTQWPPPMPPGLAWFLAIYAAVGTTVIVSEPIRNAWRKRQKRKYDEAVQTLIDNMREICTPSFFPHLHKMILKNAYGEDIGEGRTLYGGLFTEDQVDELRAEIEEINARDDWRDPASAKAWGAIYREEGKPGMAIHVQSADGHIIMDTTEWWMLQDIRRDWYKSPGGFAEMYGDAVLFPETLKLFPRYVMSPRIWEPPLTMPPILRYLRPTGNPPHPDAIEMWRWNVTRHEWEVWDEEE